MDYLCYNPQMSCEAPRGGPRKPTLKDMARDLAYDLVHKGIQNDKKAGIPEPSVQESTSRVSASMKTIMDMVFDGHARVEEKGIVFNDIPDTGPETT
jgi:hypothetical protein